MERWRSFAAPLGILLILLGAVFLVLDRKAFLSDNVAVTVVEEFGSSRAELRYIVPFTRDSEREFYLHIALDLDGDGAAGSSVGQDEWVVRNVLVRPSRLSSHTGSFPLTMEERNAFVGMSGIVVLTGGEVGAHEWGAHLPKERERVKFLIVDSATPSPVL